MRLQVSSDLKNIKITVDSDNHVYLNDYDVDNQIRQDEISMSASLKVSRLSRCKRIFS